MSETSAIGQEPNVEALLVEIASYLAAVDVFRAEGYEPCWSRALDVKPRPGRRA